MALELRREIRTGYWDPRVICIDMITKTMLVHEVTHGENVEGEEGPGQITRIHPELGNMI